MKRSGSINPKAETSAGELLETKLYSDANFFSKKLEKNENGIDVIMIEGYASTVDEDRHGDVVVPSAFTKEVIDRYMMNPVLLYAHDRKRVEGRVTEMNVDQKGLFVKAEVLADSEVGKRVQAGFIKAFSIGFGLIDYKYNSERGVFLITELELYEISLVSLPANPYAGFNLAKSLESLLGRDARQQLIETKTNAPLKMNTTESNPTPQPSADPVKTDASIFKKFLEDLKTDITKIFKPEASPSDEPAEAPTSTPSEDLQAQLDALQKNLNEVTAQRDQLQDALKGFESIQEKAENRIKEAVKELEGRLEKQLQEAKTEIETKGQEIETLKGNLSELQAKYDKAMAGKTTPEGTGSDPDNGFKPTDKNAKAYDNNKSFFM